MNLRLKSIPSSSSSIAAVYSTASSFLCISSPMGEHTLHSTRSPSPSPSSVALSSSSPKLLPAADPSASASTSPSASAAASSSLNATVAAAAASSSVSVRPRKIRKVSSSSSSEDASKKTLASSAGRLAFRVIPRPLSADGEISAALQHLRAADPHLGRVIDAHGPPTFQCLHPPFHALARSILYQQLAFKAATAVYSRFLALCGGEAGVVPEAVLALTPHQLRQIGVSARKASYLHDLARKYHSGILSDATIVAMDDKSLFTMLTMVKGIGAWSVHMFMIFSLHRPDVLPVGDLGVRKGVQMLYGLEEIPRPSQMEQLCERWRPYRSVGSWYMWRLVEAKGTPTIASSGAEGGLDMTAMGGGTIQQPQIIDPIQMLPSLG